MLTSKFLTLLRTLTKNEISEFEKYLKNNYKRQKIAISVFQYIKRYYPDFDNQQKLAIHYAYQKIFSESIEGRHGNRKKILNALHDLHLHLKQFLLWEKSKSSSVDNKMLWASLLKERKLNHEYGKFVSRLHTELECIPKGSAFDYIKSFINHHDYYYHVLKEKLNPNIDFLEKTICSLDVGYQIFRLKLACELATSKNLLIVKPEDSYELLELIHIMLDDSLFEFHPLLSTYYHLYLLIINGKPEDYLQVESILMKNSNIFALEEQHIVISYLQNFATSQIRQGRTEFWRKAHTLDKYTVEKNILTTGNIISSSQFTNIVNAACKVGEFEWALYFVNHYRNYLIKESRDNISTLAKAIIYYEQKDFNNTLDMLRSVEFNDVHQAIRTKSLTLICYFELEEEENLILDYCTSFLAFLRRNNRLKGEIIQASINFVRITKKLLEGKTPMTLMYDNIQNTTPLYFKLWLLEKASKGGK